jgi:predicted  nucleic acid-binding Zn-ribbon protein
LRGELEEKLRGELEAEKVNWEKAMEVMFNGEIQKLKDDNENAAQKLEEEKQLRIQTEGDFRGAKKQHEIFLSKKAKELREKDEAIQSLQAEVQKLKRGEDSADTLTKMNLKLKEDLRHKEELERLQQGRIATLEKEAEQQKATLELREEEIEKQTAEIDHQETMMKAEIDHLKASLGEEKSPHSSLGEVVC